MSSKADVRKTNGGGLVQWKSRFEDGEHTIGFQHNTISGNREVYLDGKELYKSGWMFKLVGTVNFKFETLGKKHVGQIKITVGGMNYMYLLTIDGKSMSRLEDVARIVSRTWKVDVGGGEHQVVLEKDVMDVWVDGSVVDATSEFVDDGTEMHFSVAGHSAVIHTVREGTKLVQVLYIDDIEHAEASTAARRDD